MLKLEKTGSGLVCWVFYDGMLYAGFGSAKTGSSRFGLFTVLVLTKYAYVCSTNKYVSVFHRPSRRVEEFGDTLTSTLFVSSPAPKYDLEH